MPYTLDSLDYDGPRMEAEWIGWGHAPGEVEARRRSEVVRNGWQNGARRLTQDEIPDGLLLKGVKNAPELGYDNAWAFAPSGALIIRDDFRKMIEDMDPGLHQFLDMPVYLKYRKEKIRARDDWYLLNILCHQETLDEKKSRGLRDLTWTSNKLIASPSGVVLDESKLSEANLWHEKGYIFQTFMSDRLHEAIKEAGIKFYKRHKVKS
ncbi:MAG: DUF1629 domain-containing protein [Pseudomonadota bacterium]